MRQKACSHLSAVESVTLPDRPAVCVECVKTGDRWVHLRTCQTCGQTHCCDSSPNQHATKHFYASNHPVIASAEPGESWLWCFADEQIMPYSLPSA
ncbi:UBP-type zinc finger domain-containing protein [Larkinella sp. C7]|jgi:uncharacterized UBP type Zn finger protein|uniref:UBP-type zinc finger domain-containing protein n=1 Tax=Larkinella sp. C7 TaxID=2576607 RepID=UPI00111104A8|nr:UBP-type zinc finger domain-containing protein [Larkinella sp. C7]